MVARITNTGRGSSRSSSRTATAGWPTSCRLRNDRPGYRRTGLDGRLRRPLRQPDIEWLRSAGRGRVHTNPQRCIDRSRCATPQYVARREARLPLHSLCCRAAVTTIGSDEHPVQGRRRRISRGSYGACRLRVDGRRRGSDRIRCRRGGQEDRRQFYVTHLLQPVGKLGEFHRGHYPDIERHGGVGDRLIPGAEREDPQGRRLPDGFPVPAPCTAIAVPSVSSLRTFRTQ